MEFYTLCLYVFAALGCYVSNGEKITIHKCDPIIVAKIKQLWGKNYPTRILITAVDKEHDVVAVTSPKLYPSDAKCINSTYAFDNTFAPFTTSNVYTIYDNGTKGKTILYLGEYKATTFGACSKHRRYFFFYEDGVSGIYICSVADYAKYGAPQVMIKVTPKFKKFAVNKAKKVGKAIVGISKWTEYPLQCPINC